MKFWLEVHLVPEYIRNLVPVSRYHGNWLTVRRSLSCGRVGPRSLWKFEMRGSAEEDGDREKQEENRRKRQRDGRTERIERFFWKEQKGWDVKTTSP